MKLRLCPKHEKQDVLQIQEEIRRSGDHIFKVKCPVCGKLGPWRKTIHGAQMAWNEISGGAPRHRPP